MIYFRCWYCNRGFSQPDNRIGQRLTCACSRAVKVPRKSWGNCRARSLTDWVVESIVYGGGGALLGLCLALVLLSKAPISVRGGRYFVVACTLTGFLAGLFTGEAGVNYIGRMIRNHQEER